MYGKALFFLMLVVVGAVLPYLLADDAWLAKMESLMGSQNARSAATEGTSDDVFGSTDHSETAPQVDAAESFAESTDRNFEVPSGSLADGAPSPISADISGRRLPLRQLAGPPGITLDQLLNFDVTPAWIASNWSRVTTRLAELDLQGWRVPVSLYETEPKLAGSVTYYFDQKRRVQRILVHGYTRNPSALVRLATSRFQMRRMLSTLSDLYVAEIEDQTIGGLRIEFARILNDRNANKQCEVLLELNRRQTKYGMSREFAEILSRAREEKNILVPIPRKPVGA